MWGPKAAKRIKLFKIIQTLTVQKISFVLIGAQALGGWTGRPRASGDIDILVKEGRNRARAVNVIKALYPNLEVRQLADVTGFFLSGRKESLIDVMTSNHEELAETLVHPVWVKDRGYRYRIPSREAALANKYGAIATPNRPLEQRMMDLADFSYLVLHSLDEGQEPIDLTKLEALGEKLWPGGGGQEILRLVELVKAGRSFNLDDLIKKPS
jgi:hypothetical protein